MIYYRKNGKDTNKIKPKYIEFIKILQTCIIEHQFIVRFDDLCYWSRHKGYWTLNTQRYDRLVDVLEEFKIKYFEYNDSPRQGLDGAYLLIKLDYRRKYIDKILKCEVE